MSKYVFLFRGGAYADFSLSPTEVQHHLKKWHEWIGGLMKAGQTHPGGNPLERSGTTLRGRDRTMTDGPYAESKDLVTGSLVVEAPSLAAATELARGCPIFEFDGSVEVRPVGEI